MTRYFDDPARAAEYIRLAEGYNGGELIELLSRLIAPGARVLELGTGPGVDLDLLAAAGFSVLGSDASQTFIDLYRGRGGQAEMMLLDAVTLDVAESFDAIYSNKVLQHLTPSELSRSFIRQAEVMRPDGVLLHSLWLGERQDEIDGLLFQQHTEASLQALLPQSLKISQVEIYTEEEPDDSLVVVFERADAE